MVSESLHTYLAADMSIAAMVDAASIGYITVNSDDATYPRIIYKKISSPAMHQATDEWQRWRFYALAENKFDVDTLLGYITDRLNNVYGTVGTDDIDNISKIDEGITIKRSDGIYEGYADFRINYH